MKNENEEKSLVLNFLAGMGIGALIGAATALLLAPKSGKETREDIAKATEELRNKAGRAMRDVAQSSETLVQRSRQLLESTKERVQNAVDSGKQAMQAKKEELAEDQDQA